MTITLGPSPGFQRLEDALDYAAKHYPTRTAVTYLDSSVYRRISYDQLNLAAQGLANTLGHHLGSSTRDTTPFVGLFFARDLNQVVATLATLIAGAAYVPIALDSNATNLGVILTQTKLEVILTDVNQHGRLGRLLEQAGRPDIVVADVSKPYEFDSHPTHTNLHPRDGQSPAYVLFSSGTTGPPKGIVTSHRAALTYCKGANELYQASSLDTWVRAAAYTFDSSIDELFCPLVAGAGIVIQPDGALTSFSSYLGFLKTSGATILAMTTALWHQLTGYVVHEDLDLPSSIRVVSIGGEAALGKVFKAWRERFKDYPRLLNGYGPTEATIRGFRIELESVETCLLSFPGVKEVAVAAHKDEQVQSQAIHAYIVIGSDKNDIYADDIVAHCAQTLAPYEIPARFYHIEALPYTRNRKLDRRALGEIRNLVKQLPSREQVTNGDVGKLNLELAQLWCQCLDGIDLDSLSTSSHFLHLGGHSLTLIMLAAKIDSVMGVAVSSVDLLQSPTLGQMSELLEARRREAAVPNGHPSPDNATTNGSARDLDVGIHPLSSAQARLYVAQQSAPESPVFNDGVAINIAGEISDQDMCAALKTLIQRHAILRVKLFQDDTAQVLQEIIPFDDVLFNAVFSYDKLERPEAVRRAHEIFVRPFNLFEDFLIRIALLSSGTEHILVICAHHIIWDGFSDRVFLDELVSLYQGKALSHGSSYFAHCYSLQAKPFPDRLSALLSYLDSVPQVLELPVDYVRPDSQTFSHGRNVHFTINQSSVSRLVSRLGASPYACLMTAFAVALHINAAGQEDFMIGVPFANRLMAGEANAIGFFINMLPLRVRLADTSTLDELHTKIRKDLLFLSGLQNVPLDALVDALGFSRLSSRDSLIQAVLNFTDAPEGRLDHRAQFTRYPLNNGAAHTDMVCFVELSKDGSLAGEIEYNSDIFAHESMASFASAFTYILDTWSAQPAQSINGIPFPGSASHIPLVRELRPEDHSFGAFLVSSAARYWTCQAVYDDTTGSAYTYQQVFSMAHRIQQQLQPLRRTDGVVVLLLERNIDAVAAEIAVSSAGLAFAPCDVSQPRLRTEEIIANCDPGPCLMLGYLNMPDLNKQKMLVKDGVRGWRSGDMGRHLPSGGFEVFGRMDSMCKVKGGFRVDLGEIETHIRTYTQVVECCVSLMDIPMEDDRVSRNHIVAFVKLTNEQDLLQATAKSQEGDKFDSIVPETVLNGLHRHLSHRVPAYMIPDYAVRMSAFPLTDSGKIDRFKLPKPSLVHRFAPTTSDVAEWTAEDASRRETIEAILGIFTTLLSIDRKLTHRDNFYDCGGHSLLAARVTCLIRRDLGVPLPFTAIITHPTASELAEFVEALKLQSARSIKLPPHVIPLQPAGLIPQPKAMIFAFPFIGGDLDMVPRVVNQLDNVKLGLVTYGLVPEPGRKLDSLEKMAKAYAESIAQLAGSIPCILVGWCFGGMIASKALLYLPQETTYLVLFDVMHISIAGRFQMDEADFAKAFAEYLCKVWFGPGLQSAEKSGEKAAVIQAVLNAKLDWHDLPSLVALARRHVVLPPWVTDDDLAQRIRPLADSHDLMLGVYRGNCCTPAEAIAIEERVIVNMQATDGLNNIFDTE
ncbi:hypothetical protein FRC06_002424, partial [Ceratobasidium sp. 370]